MSPTARRLAGAAVLTAHGLAHVLAFGGVAPAGRGTGWVVALLPGSMSLTLIDLMAPITATTFIAAAIAVSGARWARTGVLLIAAGALLSLLTFGIAANGMLPRAGWAWPGAVFSAGLLVASVAHLRIGQRHRDAVMKLPSS